ncbi:hypothetical protein HBI38_240470 [Parastagonospora nodorum]|nr:hypothetical protein HBI73_242090 [Parastagonospora nodorum]KAH6296155.1 hypothetical protein HBI38_240470 [Parastagonospora nodorum]
MQFFTSINLRTIQKNAIVEIKNYAKRNSTIFITRDYTIIKLTRLTRRLQKYICTANTRRIVRGLENSASTSPLVYSNYALQEYSLLKVIAAYTLNYLKLQVLKLINLGYDSISLQSNSLRCLTLIGTVLYNAIKEYYDDRTRKIIYFYSYTIEEDYNCAEKREDNILTIDKCRTGHSNKKDIEANKREKETKVQLRELLEKIYNILLREFREANNFTESVIYNDDKQV